jgi:nucleoid-associated protein EbfC
MNINKMMQQAQAMQKKMEELKNKMATTEYEGKSGGGLVLVTVTGEGLVKGVKIDNSIIVQNEKEMLEDLIVAAINDAKAKVEEDSQNQMSSAMSGLGLPSGFKMPF